MKDQAVKDTKSLQAQLTMNSTYAAASAINALHDRGKLLDFNTLIDELIASTRHVNTDNLAEVEQMLLMQAKTLDYVFYDALKKLVDLDMINQIEVFTGIAFKAQSLSRKALTALIQLKRPQRATFVKQQNNAINQQINENKIQSEKYEKVANELLSEVMHETLDFGGATKASHVNREVEAMGAFNGG